MTTDMLGTIEMGSERLMGCAFESRRTVLRPTGHLATESSTADEHSTQQRWSPS